MSAPIDPRRAIALLYACNLPLDVKSWLIAGFEQHLAGHGTLCCCLGLRGPGIRSYATTERERRRNICLVRAAKFIAGDSPMPLWKRAGLLSEALMRYQRGRPVIHGKAHLRGHLTEALQKAHGYDSDCPTSQRHLYDLLARTALN